MVLCMFERLKSNSEYSIMLLDICGKESKM